MKLCYVLCNIYNTLNVNNIILDDFEILQDSSFIQPFRFVI